MMVADHQNARDHKLAKAELAKILHQHVTIQTPHQVVLLLAKMRAQNLVPKMVQLIMKVVDHQNAADHKLA